MSRKYSGDLAKPRKLAPLGLLHTPAQREAGREADIAEVERRMDLLFEEHGVTAGDWKNLCWSLAFDLPGFQLASVNPVGRPKCWNDWTRALLVLSIEELRTQKEFSVNTATQHLAKQEPWRSMVRHALGDQRLRRESTRLIDQPFLSMLRDARDQMIASGEITDKPGAFAHKYLATNYAQDELKNEQ